jgi:hypothetical protein
MELACDTSLKIKFEALPLIFLISLGNEYMELSHLAIDTLLVFGTAYMRERNFSAISATKLRYLYPLA